MENETINLTNLICDSLNSIFYKIFSSIDTTAYSTLDNILFIHTDITENTKFQQIFGTDSTNGLLLIANSLILGILLFYILKFTFSHLTYCKIDSPYQFIFKCITFVACMNSSLWLCDRFIYLISSISDAICYLGTLVTGEEISFSHLVVNINSALYPSLDNFDIFSLDGVIKLCSNIGIVYILLIYSIRYILCKILILLSPFAFASLITNQMDGFFKGWFKYFCILLCMQIFVSLVLILGFTLDFYSGDVLSKLIYFAIIAIIAKCHYRLKSIFSSIYNYSNNKLKNVT